MLMRNTGGPSPTWPTNDLEAFSGSSSLEETLKEVRTVTLAGLPINMLDHRSAAQLRTRESHELMGGAGRSLPPRPMAKPS